MAQESRIIDKTLDEMFEDLFTPQKNFPKLKHTTRKNLKAFYVQLLASLDKEKIVLRDGDSFHKITFDPLLQQDVTKPTLVFNELVRLLIDAKNEQKEEAPLIIDKDIGTIFTHCQIEGLRVGKELLKAKRYEERKKLEEAMLKFVIFWQTQCCRIENRKLKDVNQTSSIGESCIVLVRISLQLENKDKDTAKKNLQWLKRIIKIYPQDFRIEKIEHLREYYIGMATLAILDNDYTQAKEYVLKAVDYDDFIEEKHSQFGRPYRPNQGLIDLCEAVMKEMFKQNELNQALFWAKLEKKGCEKIFKFRDEPIPLSRKYSFVVLEGDPEVKSKLKQSSTNRIKFLKIIIDQTKSKILIKNVGLIKQAFNDEKINAQFKTNDVKDDKKAYSVLNIKLEDCDSIFLLLKALKANNIICSNDKKKQAISIYDLHHIDTKALLRALQNWKNQVSRNLEIEKPIYDTFCQEPFIPVQKILSGNSENITILEETADEKPVSKNKLEKQVENRPEQTPNTLEQKPKKKPNKTVIWGEGYPIYEKNSPDCRFFKLRGPTAIRHYLYIKPELYEEISHQDPLMARNLLRICERGKVINNSKGNKGIIFTEQEQEKVKIKDPRKDYRFFGDVVRSTKQKDGKTYTLVEINAYTQTHKQKIATKF